jgi:hypothetical protein
VFDRLSRLAIDNKYVVGATFRNIDGRSLVSDWFVSVQDVSGAFIEKCRERRPGAVRGVARSMSREQPIGTFVVIASHFGQTAS